MDKATNPYWLFCAFKTVFAEQWVLVEADDHPLQVTVFAD